MLKPTIKTKIRHFTGNKRLKGLKILNWLYVTVNTNTKL